jgi:hypothetical protein
MSSNVEMDAWRLLWQTATEAPVAADLRDRVARETRRRRVLLIAPIAVTATMGTWTLARVIDAPDFDNVVLTVEAWIFMAVAWAAGLWIDRGSWRPMADTTAAFVEISIRRCRATLLSLRLGGVMYVWQLLFISLWRLATGTDAAVLLTSWSMILLGWIGLPAFFAFVAIYGRIKRAELEYLLALLPGDS